MKDFLTLLKLSSITNYLIYQILVIYLYHILQQEQVQWIIMNVIAFFVNKIPLEGQKNKQESVTISQMYSKCYQKIGRGIQHPCLASPAKTAESISNAVKELDPKTQDQVLYSLLKSKSELNEKSKSDKIKIHTPGSFTSIQINPSTSKESPTLSTETIDNIRLQAGLSLNQTKLILGGIRADLGHHAVPAHYREHASKQGQLLKKCYCFESNISCTYGHEGFSYSLRLHVAGSLAK